MKARIALASTLVATWIFACSSNPTTQENSNEDGEGTASMSFALSGGDFSGNSVRICGSRTEPDLKYRCESTLAPNGNPCPCFNFTADGRLEDPVTGAPAVIRDLCPSVDFPDANWSFQYEIYSDLDCGGTRLNDGTHNLTCYDSHDIATQAYPNQTIDEVLEVGANTNYILCNTNNASKVFDFMSCATATTTDDELANQVRFNCGCTLQAGACSCGTGGVTVGDLEIGCTFDPDTCDIVCPAP